MSTKVPRLKEKCMSSECQSRDNNGNMERSTDGISPHRLQPPVSQLSLAAGRWIGGSATQVTLFAFRCCWLLTHRFLRAVASQQASSNGFAKRRVSTMLSGRDWLGGLARSGASAMAVCRSRLFLFLFFPLPRVSRSLAHLTTRSALTCQRVSIGISFGGCGCGGVVWGISVGSGWVPTCLLGARWEEEKTGRKKWTLKNQKEEKNEERRER